MVPDQKLRYQQLLFLAKKLPEMDAALQAEEERGIARFRDVVTQLHNKHHMTQDPDTVLGCGPEDQVKAAPPGRPMVILEPDFATSGKFWRVSRDKGVLVWHKTSILKLEDGLGWYREAHRDDGDATLKKQYKDLMKTEMLLVATALQDDGKPKEEEKPKAPKAPKAPKPPCQNLTIDILFNTIKESTATFLSEPKSLKDHVY